MIETPYSLEVEQAILGSIFLNNQNLDNLVLDIKETDFYLITHQLIYRAMLNLFDNNIGIDYISIETELKKICSDRTIEIEYITALIEKTPFIFSLQKSKEILVEYSKRRQLIALTTLTNHNSFDYTKPLTEILSEHERLFSNITGIFKSTETEPIKNIIRNLGDSFTNDTGIKTQYTELNDKIIGFRKSDFIGIASWSSVGKTSFALNLVENISVQQGIPSLFFSLETTKIKILYRFISLMTQINSYRVQQLNFSKDELELCKKTMEILTKSPVYIDDVSDLGFYEIARKIKKAIKDYKIEIVFIDYFQLVRTEKEKNKNRENELSELSKQFRRFAKEVNIPIVLLAQLKDLEGREKRRRPIASDLRESKALFHDLDLLLLLHRESYFTQKNEDKAELIIAKNKEGETKIINLKYSKHCFLFENPGSNNFYKTKQKDNSEIYDFYTSDDKSENDEDL
jgi:replicative DNA helicase